jgi:hypothetical protein
MPDNEEKSFSKSRWCVYCRAPFHMKYVFLLLLLLFGATRYKK